MPEPAGAPASPPTVTAPTTAPAAVPTYVEYRRRARRLARGRALIWALLGAGVAWAVWGTGFGVVTLVQGLAVAATFVATDLLPPRIEVLPQYAGPALDTLAMSYAGMLLAVVLSLPLGVLAARTTTVHHAVANAARTFVAFVRAVPELVFAIFLVSVFGVGPLAGVLALGVGGAGILAKAYADALESVDMRQVEGIRAAGGTWPQVLVQGVWPQFQPSFVTWSLYRLDLNIREATVLGLVGAGGIGLSLQQAISLFQYRSATAIILLIFAMILLVETLTAALRRRILGGAR